MDFLAGAAAAFDLFAAQGRCAVRRLSQRLTAWTVLVTTSVNANAISSRLSRLSTFPMSKVFGYIFLLGIVLVILFPIYWLVITSLKVQREFFTKPPIFFPSEFTLNNYG